MKITQEMVNEFNESLEMLQCSFRIKINYQYSDWEVNPTCSIIPSNDMYIDSTVFNMSKDFYTMLENFFETKGIKELAYNNTGSTFWARFGYID